MTASCPAWVLSSCLQTFTLSSLKCIFFIWGCGGCYSLSTLHHKKCFKCFVIVNFHKHTVSSLKCPLCLFTSQGVLQVCFLLLLLLVIQLHLKEEGSWYPVSCIQQFHNCLNIVGITGCAVGIFCLGVRSALCCVHSLKLYSIFLWSTLSCHFYQGCLFISRFISRSLAGGQQ